VTDEDRLAAAVPAHVRDICERLARAGFEAVTVGGAVRDALLGRPPKDWDVATRAHPDQILALFRRSRAIGGHTGTIQVGEVEVTPFRSEGAYSDARRPDTVTFGVSLDEDLLRRDFTVNAIAFDPTARVVRDPYAGRSDLASRVLRAVGDPIARFTEDGLRVMRAVRFVAQLEFELERETEEALERALPSLAKVSRERVSEELRKLLAAERPARALAIARRRGIVRAIAAELDTTLDDEALSRVDRADKSVRLAVLAAPLGEPRRAEEILRSLKFSNDEAALARALVAIAPIDDDPSPPRARKLLAAIARASRPHVEPYLRALGHDRSADAVHAIAGDPLDASDLAITGDDLMRELALPPGPKLGVILKQLRADVLDDPSRNTRDHLLARAAELAR
jgi:tRNA nucleotidyltransferase (CCA-adding enzyme)